jgi:hypothetical protein
MKYDISVNTYGHFDFPTVGVTVYRSGIAFSQPLTGMNSRQRERERERERKMCRLVIYNTATIDAG